MKILLVTALLGSVAFKLPDELIGTNGGHSYIIAITGLFIKLVKAITITRVPSGNVAKLFVHNSVFNYGPPMELISYNGSQFTSTLFMDVCCIRNTKKAFTATYNTQNNGQFERVNRMMLAYLRLYIEHNLCDWDLYTAALTYCYNAQPQRSTSIESLNFVISRYPTWCRLTLRNQDSLAR